MRRDVFQAIADPTRREIISLLSTKSMNLNSVAEKFNISRPAISKHIKILNQCGLLRIKKYGRERYCDINLDKIKEVDEWLDPFRQMWEDRFNKLDEILNINKPKK
ncbi:MAG TPA: metalloregulator ArsR/SmtB family transcription factor [Ignavibacteria bacterium]|nr:metalloregulator ArsR/SmtB family transcription factor [Ignavibacteria bacterium]HMR41114.1 metalloregulator ArsR/SmtB family transcription factor [Ignavibacteria bacterium]